MNIPINDDYRIRSDPFNIILEKSRIVSKEGKNKGETAWDIIGFYTSVENALQALVTRDIMMSDCNSLEGLRALVGTLREDIAAMSIGTE